MLVTEPLAQVVRHKVYAGEYVANVLSSDAGLQTSPVVESTPSGTVLIGSSRERVGFDRTVSLPVLTLLARHAVALFPMLRTVQGHAQLPRVPALLSRTICPSSARTDELRACGTRAGTRVPGSACRWAPPSSSRQALVGTPT